MKEKKIKIEEPIEINYTTPNQVELTQEDIDTYNKLTNKIQQQQIAKQKAHEEQQLKEQLNLIKEQKLKEEQLKKEEAYAQERLRMQQIMQQQKAQYEREQAQQERLAQEASRGLSNNIAKQLTPESIENQKSTKKSKLDELKESFGFDTLNPLMYKWFNAILLVNMLIFVILILATGGVYLFFNNLYLTIATGALATISMLMLIITFAITSTTLKKNDLIVIRKYRSGSGKISRTNLKGKSTILFDKKDQASRVLISWSGAITDPISGCKIIQISEGHPTNDNLNAQVTESEWDKDVSRLTKAKSVADLAEAELFNQGLLGLKWQDIVLLVIGVMTLVIFGYLIMGAPDAIAKKTIEGLMNGNIQQAVTQAITNSGLLGNPVPVP